MVAQPPAEATGRAGDDGRRSEDMAIDFRQTFTKWSFVTCGSGTCPRGEHLAGMRPSSSFSLRGRVARAPHTVTSGRLRNICQFGLARAVPCAVARYTPAS